MRRIVFVFAALALVASCAPYQLVAPPERVTISDAYSVAPQIEWSRANVMVWNDVEQWTVDGAGLELLMFVNKVEDGKPLFPVRHQDAMPVFRSSMNSLEVKDFFVASMAGLQAQRVKVRKLRPVQFGGVDGFRFDFSYTTKGGLEKRGIAKGAVRKGKLYMILYMGTRLHYFDKYKRAAEGVMRSVQFL